MVTTGGIMSWSMSGKALGVKSMHPLRHGAGPSQRLATAHQYTLPVWLVGMVICATVPDNFATGRFWMNCEPQLVSDPRSRLV